MSEKQYMNKMSGLIYTDNIKNQAEILKLNNANIWTKKFHRECQQQSWLIGRKTQWAWKQIVWNYQVTERKKNQEWKGGNTANSTNGYRE